MSKLKEIGLRQRIINLKKFIKDGKVIGFSLVLMSSLTAQLTELESEQNRDETKRKTFYKNTKLQNYKNVVQKCSALVV